MSATTLYISDSADILPAEQNFHGISNEIARARGVPLRQALLALGGALKEVEQKQGKVLSFNLEFDCGIVAREMERALQASTGAEAEAMQDHVARLSRLARQGYCVMWGAKAKPKRAKLVKADGRIQRLGASPAARQHAGGSRCTQRRAHGGRRLFLGSGVHVRADQPPRV